jgi:hypothetical protein
VSAEIGSLPLALNQLLPLNQRFSAMYFENRSSDIVIADLAGKSRSSVLGKYHTLTSFIVIAWSGQKDSHSHTDALLFVLQ